MSVSGLGILKQVGGLPKFLTPSQIKNRGEAAMHIVLRADHHKNIK